MDTHGRLKTMNARSSNVAEVPKLATDDALERCLVKYKLALKGVDRMLV